MSVPKRHHFVPQMILNGFTDEGGWLHWCRREQPGVIRRARPAELFHRNHLYSTVSESGIKDAAMERFLSVLESAAVHVIDAIARAARAGRCPELCADQRLIWRLFFLLQWRRAPETQRANTSDEEADRMVREILDRLRVEAPHMAEEIERFDTEEARTRTVRNVRVQTLIRFSAEVMGVLERRGMAVARLVRPGKALVVGSRPVVKLTSPGRTDLSDPGVEMWLPITSDVVVGVGRGDGGVSLHAIEDDRFVRHLNLAIARQSGTIAARSAALVRSVSNPR